ncbi:phytanoyl-CoA dioxygenase family protein [Sphaerisporangium fuscum]|uniref:phytanoyl-CoA dioxygenase family protein n=1 Tax=Sphaerisporangium fuscum TaxID=2835868 RepID=UPI001BDCA7A8|nr:phytanoyl-CoA dioxygenase family protein [Sphaerisporangium fuscum]
MNIDSTLRPHLDALDDRYCEVLALTPHAEAIIRSPGPAHEAGDRFLRAGFVRIPGVVSPAALEALAGELWPILSPLAFAVRVPHTTGPAGTLLGGGRLRRVDTGSLERDGQGDALASVLRAVGLVEFGRLLADRLAPILRHVIGPAVYERMFFNLYDEGDYISPHDDAHMGDRIDVTFPVTLDGVGGLRVLSGGYLETHYDGEGAMSVLGPRVWHEVPPLLRVSPERPPRRLTITMRYV